MDYGLAASPPSIKEHPFEAKDKASLHAAVIRGGKIPFFGITLVDMGHLRKEIEVLDIGGDEKVHHRIRRNGEGILQVKLLQHRVIGMGFEIGHCISLKANLAEQRLFK